MSEEEKIAHELRLLYASTLKEPIPAEWTLLLSLLEQVASVGDEPEGPDLGPMSHAERDAYLFRTFGI